MAMNVGSSGGEPDVMMDINTTPLIDVMLVLLVMLIITIPIKCRVGSRCCRAKSMDLFVSPGECYSPMNCSLPTMPIFVRPSRCAEAMTPATTAYFASLLGRR